jgi:hypothetical protein
MVIKTGSLNLLELSGPVKGLYRDYFTFSIEYEQEKLSSVFCRGLFKSKLTFLIFF